MNIKGRLSPFIELGVGFNPDLPARDNVIINAIMLGLTRKQAQERFDDILRFAELEEFVDLKLKNYSSGMYVRLAFATAVQVDADILLIDEVLAVGDAAFQQKCFEEFTRLQNEGRTIVFVTHDMGAVERFCNRAMLLERGRIVDIGEPAAIARKYNQLNFGRAQEGAKAAAATPEAPRDVEVAQIMNAWFESPDGELTVTANQGEPLSVRIDVRFVTQVDDPIFAIVLQSENGNAAFITNNWIQQATRQSYPPGSTAKVRMRFENCLAPGRYLLVASVARAGLGADVLDLHESNSIIVMADRAGGGLADPPHTYEIECVES